MESITNIYMRLYSKLSNVLEELGNNLPLEDIARALLYLLHDNREKRQVIRNRFRGRQKNAVKFS